MHYAYKNVLVRLGADIDKRIGVATQEMAVQGWVLFQVTAMPDLGGIQLMFRRNRYHVEVEG